MKPIKIIYGVEDYLLERSRNEFLASWQRKLGADVDIHVFTKTSDVQKVIESFEGASLFGSGGISVWNDCPFLPIKKGGKSRSKLTQDETLFLGRLAELSDMNALLFFTKGVIDTHCGFYKKISALADVTACKEITDKEVMPYVVDYLRGKGKRLTLPAEHFLHELFHTWDKIPLLYVFSELDKVCIALGDTKEGIDIADLDTLFAGTMEKNLFTFMEAFLYRDAKKALPLAGGLFAKQDLFLKNCGFMVSRLRLLLAYKELVQSRAGKGQIESIMTSIQDGRNAKYLIYHLQKQAKYWKLSELDELLCRIFTLQLNIRRGVATVADMEPLICLFIK